jgi:predicted nucleic acid-binding protein
VSRTVVLDAGPLGAACNPLSTPTARACTQWLQNLAAAGVTVVIPEIADYEVRREFVRAGMLKSMARLDQLARALPYVPISTSAMRKAADFWAQARNQGLPATSNVRLDADAILAGQAAALGVPNVIVATSNVGHLSQLVPAAHWTAILP